MRSWKEQKARSYSHFFFSLSLSATCQSTRQRTSPVLLFLACSVFLCARVSVRSRLRALWPSLSRISRSDQRRQLAVQLASLAFLEDVVTHSVQSLLPTSTDDRALPASLPRPPLSRALLYPSHSAPPRVDSDHRTWFSHWLGGQELPSRLAGALLPLLPSLQLTGSCSRTSGV